MDAARHKIVARALGARRGQDRRLEFGEALADHAAADRGDHVGAQHDIGVDALAPQIEEAIAQADILGIIGLARHRQRQLLRGRLDGDAAREHLDLAGREVGIGGARGTRLHDAVDRDDRFDAQALEIGSAGLSLSATIWVMP
jgi:hypothetical protein